MEYTQNFKRSLKLHILIISSLWFIYLSHAPLLVLMMSHKTEILKLSNSKKNTIYT